MPQLNSDDEGGGDQVDMEGRLTECAQLRGYDYGEPVPEAGALGTNGAPLPLRKLEGLGLLFKRPRANLNLHQLL